MTVYSAKDIRRLALAQHALSPSGREAVRVRMRQENAPLHAEVLREYARCLTGDMSGLMARAGDRVVFYRQLAAWPTTGTFADIASLEAADQQALAAAAQRHTVLRTSATLLTCDVFDDDGIEPDDGVERITRDQTTISDLLDSSTTPASGEDLYRVIKHFQVTEALELGVGLGVGAMYIAAACQAVAAQRKSTALYVGIEGSENLCAHAGTSLLAGSRRELRYALICSPISEALRPAVRLMRQQRPTKHRGLQFAHIDAFRYPNATLRMFKQVVEAMPLGGLVCINNLQCARLAPIRNTLLTFSRVRAWFQIPSEPRGLYCLVIDGADTDQACGGK